MELFFYKYNIVIIIINLVVNSTNDKNPSKNSPQLCDTPPV